VTVPDRQTAAALLIETVPPDWLVRHARAVAEVAAWLAARTAARGILVDRRLVEAAALLHDLDKALPVGHPARILPHGEGSAAWLAERGHPELGPAVAGHPVTRLGDGVRFSGWLATSSHEERIVAYADKRAGARLERMDDRFASWRRRYPGGWDDATAVAVRRRAARLEDAVCDAAGIRPDEVRRLRWTGPPLVAARDRAAIGGSR
jgi:hypothetical protein